MDTIADAQRELTAAVDEPSPLNPGEIAVSQPAAAQ